MIANLATVVNGPLPTCAVPTGHAAPFHHCGLADRVYGAGQVDLEASQVLWQPSRSRAEQVERSLHKSLAPYRAEPEHRATGRFEWLDGRAHPMALRLLRQMPLDERSDHPGRLVPLLQEELPPEDVLGLECGPLAIWWALEDLGLRLAMHCRVTVEREGDTHTLVFAGLRHALDGPLLALRTEVMDTANTYTWRTAGQTNQFVKLVDFRGHDIVCTLATLRLIETWPEGADLVWQVRGFMLRLKRMAQASVARARRA